jgi:type II secretory pathway pseudopilin PulG
MRTDVRVSRRFRGFTMTETAIVLGVVGIVLGGIWVAAGSVMRNGRTKQAVQDIVSMASNIRATYMATNSFSISGNQTAAMITAGIVPSTLQTGVPANPTVNPWGGAVRITFQPATAPTPTPGVSRTFRISYFGTPVDACLGLASVLANLGTSDAPVQMVTNSASLKLIPNTPPVGLTIAQIQTECMRNMTGTNVNASASTEFDFAIH